MAVRAKAEPPGQLGHLNAQLAERVVERNDLLVVLRSENYRLTHESSGENVARYSMNTPF